MKKFSYLFFIIFLINICTSCEEEVLEFGIPDSQLNFTFKDVGGTKFASINLGGEFTAESDQEWCVTEIYRTQGTNNVRISVSKNELATDRTANITVTAQGKDTIIIKVQQELSLPFININPRSVMLSQDVRNFSLLISANTDFECNLPNWIQSDGVFEAKIGEHTYNFIVDENDGFEREGTITFVGLGANSNLTVNVPIIQSVLDLPILDENFTWATGHNDIYTSTNEIRIDNWPIQGKGWTSTTANVFDIWTRNGYLKFCRGNTGADLVTPKLSSIRGVQDVVVTFKACGYLSGTGITDKYSEFNISVIGGGVPTITHFDITNYPDFGAKPNGPNWKWQDHPDAEYTFKVIGATSETQIVFLAGPKLGAIDGNSRMGFDDVKVVLDK